MFWYLATPYARYPEGHEAAFKLARDNAMLLTISGIPAYSPIAHNHLWKLPDGIIQDHDFWMKVDRPFMKAAHGIIVLLAKSWENSAGMREEIKTFEEDGKPFAWMSPGVVPHSLLK